MAHRVHWRQRALAVSSAGVGLTLLLSGCGWGGISGRGAGDKTVVGLITKTNDNPYYVTMQESAEKKARELGVDLRSFAGQSQTDNDSQVQAIEYLMAAGAKGILITPADSNSIVPAINRARRAGVMVVALDSPTAPASAVDATFSTDNTRAGRQIGRWAKDRMAGRRTRMALLDISSDRVAVDIERDQGFLQGFGVDVRSPRRIGDERDPRIVGHETTNANEEGGRGAMEKLLQRDPSINLVYAVNEPAAAGAYQAVKAAGRQKRTTIVSIDGGCPGVRNVASGALGATSMQFPKKMAAKGVAAVDTYVKKGRKPSRSPGLDFTDTGAALITDTHTHGLPSRKTDWGLTHCWG
jgi:fructose transport system substrate-binding protein